MKLIAEIIIKEIILLSDSTLLKYKLLIFQIIICINALKKKSKFKKIMKIQIKIKNKCLM